MHKKRNTICKLRSPLGANQLEFAGAFVVLVLVVLVPLINLCAIPVRLAFANSAVKDTVHQLALSNKKSQAVASANSLLRTRLDAITGVNLKSSYLAIVASSAGKSSPPFSGPIPEDWLPDGKGGPFHYDLLLECQIEVTPLFLVSAFDMAIPGLTTGLSTKISDSYSWENLGKNPDTQKFYLNE